MIERIRLWVDIVAKRFLVRERRTVFSRLGRIGYFDSQNRPFGFYYCRISLAGPLLGDFCNKIGHKLTHAAQQIWVRVNEWWPPSSQPLRGTSVSPKIRGGEMRVVIGMLAVLVLASGAVLALISAKEHD